MKASAALRPQRVQESLWAALEGTELTQYLAHPSRGSIHSFGMAVDITLVDAHGRELDMGTPFDDLTERSHPVLEPQLLASAGWQGITREWWHFDFGDREAVRAGFLRVL